MQVTLLRAVADSRLEDFKGFNLKQLLGVLRIACSDSLSISTDERHLSKMSSRPPWDRHLLWATFFHRRCITGQMMCLSKVASCLLNCQDRTSCSCWLGCCHSVALAEKHENMSTNTYHHDILYVDTYAASGCLQNAMLSAAPEPC